MTEQAIDTTDIIDTVASMASSELTIQPGDLIAWRNRSGPGQRLRYHQSPSLMRERLTDVRLVSVATEAWDLYLGGRATLSNGDGDFDYFIVSVDGLKPVKARL